jgi:NAD(P)-dependent dehydrogenase (short-subunit alcohol dehydrogenase family)
MSVLIFGGGGIAQGIKRVVRATILEQSDVDVRDAQAVWGAVYDHSPTVVVNCAGVSCVGRIGESDPALWEQDIIVNLIGSYHVARACCERGVKTMIFLASVAGMYGKPNHSSYCASKAGVISLVQSLAMEGHDAYAISPGRVDTPMRQRDYPNDTPGSRLRPEDIGGVVREILDGKHTPGSNLVIRKEGLVNVIREVDRGEPWRDRLRVGLPVTI